MSITDTNRLAVTIRASRAEDAPILHAFVDGAIERLAYGEGARSAFATALAGSSDEARALVAVRDGQPIGVVVYGAIAGTMAAGRIQLVVVDATFRRRGIGSALVRAALTALARERIRVAFIELAGDAALAEASAFLTAAGFSVEAAVSDYYRDGVDLLVLRRELLVSEG